MALYHFSATQIKRSAGQSAIAAAAYRAGEKLFSTYYNEYSDYTQKGGVVHSEIFLPAYAPPEYCDRAALWNAVEHFEKHPQAQLAYSFDIALQNELTMDENIELARAFVQNCFVDRGMIADLAVHAPEKENGIQNPHFHVLTTMRPLNKDGTFGQKQQREYMLNENGERIRDESRNYVFNAVHTTDWHKPETLEAWRAKWCEIVNAKFAEKKLDCRIDHRSYARQGIDQIPTVHEGPNVRKMEAKGIRTEKGSLNRWIAATNRILHNLKKQIESLSDWIAELRTELSKPQEPTLYERLISYYEQRNAGAWSQPAHVQNLKRLNAAINYLNEHNLTTAEDLAERISDLRDLLSAHKKKTDACHAQIHELQERIRYAEQVKRYRPIAEEYEKIRWKSKREKFKYEHDYELNLYYLARRKLSGNPIAVSKWKQELPQLKEQYDAMTQDQRPLQEELRRLQDIRYWTTVQNTPRKTTHRTQETEL